MSECEHKEKFWMPDSLAQVCKACGQVWVDGEPWNYKSGNIREWVEDLAKSSEGEDE